MDALFKSQYLGVALSIALVVIGIIAIATALDPNASPVRKAAMVIYALLP